MTAALLPDELDSRRRPYTPHGAARELWSHKGPEVVLSGPAGTGKSRACLEKLHWCCLKYPGMRGLIVRKTRESLTETALVTFENIVVPTGDPLLEGPTRRFRQAYSYPNGSEIVVGGLDKAEKIMSSEYDLIYAQELIELTEHDWELCSTRLRNGVMPYMQLLGDTNPGAPSHWLKQRADAGRCVMLESRHEDNPRLWDRTRRDWTAFGKQYLETLERLTGVRLPRLRHGRWVQAEGAVYEEWDRALHLIDRFPIPASWPRFRSIDFGFTNPFACGWFALDPDGRLYLYREIYRTQRTVKDHAKEILRHSAGETITATIADHDAEDRATLEQEGIRTEKAFKAISPGIQAVQERLKPAGDRRPRLFILRDSLVERDESLAALKKPCCTEQEMDSYCWPKGKDGKPLKEAPVDEHNHGLDMLRYMVARADGLGGPRELVSDSEAWQNFFSPEALAAREAFWRSRSEGRR